MSQLLSFSQTSFSKNFKFHAKLATAVLVGVTLTACSTSKISTNKAKTYYPSAIPSHYIVQYGDTLSKIAQRYGLDYRQIGALNGLDSNYTIKVGQRLMLTAPNQRQQYQQRQNQPVSNQKPTTARQTTPVNSVPTYANSGKWLVPVNGRLLRGYDESIGTRGVWYTAQRGTPVVASKGGTILYVGNGLPEYGNLVMIQHSDDYITAYAHLGSFSVQEKQVVQAGQQIGTVGHVANMNQPAVEFQIRYRGLPINPINMLK